jgi:hypothetical protein
MNKLVYTYVQLEFVIGQAVLKLLSKRLAVAMVNKTVEPSLLRPDVGSDHFYMQQILQSSDWSNQTQLIAACHTLLHDVMVSSSMKDEQHTCSNCLTLYNTHTRYSP